MCSPLVIANKTLTFFSHLLFFTYLIVGSFLISANIEMTPTSGQIGQYLAVRFTTENCEKNGGKVYNLHMLANLSQSID